jgi:hypothetical protein
VLSNTSSFVKAIYPIITSTTTDAKDHAAAIKDLKEVAMFLNK